MQTLKWLWHKQHKRTAPLSMLDGDDGERIYSRLTVQLE